MSEATEVAQEPQVLTPDPGVAQPGEPSANETPVVKPEASTGQETVPEGDPPKKKLGGFQKQIRKLEGQVSELQSRLSAEAAQKAAQVSQAEEKAPDRDSFENLDDYHRALARHEYRRMANEDRARTEVANRQEQARQSREQLASSWEALNERAAEKFDDAPDVLEHFARDVALSEVALHAVIESDVGELIAMHLGKNDAEAARIGKLSPARQAVEIGKLEIKLSEKKVSGAPAPITPVSGTSGNAKLEYRPDMSQEEYSRLRARRKGRI